MSRRSRTIAAGHRLRTDLDAAYEWDNQGRMTALVYPPDTASSDTRLRYTQQYDAMGRLNGMQDVPCAVPNGNVC